MMRSALHVANALLVAMLAVVSAGWPAHALSPEDERSSTRSAPAASSPLLDALAFASPDTISFEFTDWTVLKALHDGSDGRHSRRHRPGHTVPQRPGRTVFDRGRRLRSGGARSRRDR